MKKFDRENLQTMEDFIFGIAYDYDKNDVILWVNSNQILRGRMSELPNEVGGKFLKELNTLLHLYLVCKGDKKLQQEIIDKIST